MGRPATSLSQYVLKVHSRCDLACDHCYVYEAADQGWRSQPKAMTDPTIAEVARRIAEHAQAHGLDQVSVVLHGGEPLLAGRARLELIARSLRGALDGTCRLDLRIHTNGIRLDQAFCELFTTWNIKVGISVDGDRAANNRHRRFADGRGSYDQVIAAISLLGSPAYRHLFAGLLCTVDVANDPVAVYEALRALAPPQVDFLLPHATWEAPPARPAGQAAPYANWLITIFDRWLADGRPFRVRTFDSIIATSRGHDSRTEALGLSPADLIVIETDGSYEQVDSLKVAFDGAARTGLNVFSHPIDAAASHPGVAARQHGLDDLCATCQACPVVASCGGGLYAHRFRAETGFANTSVYCADLMRLIRHISNQADQARPPEAAGPTLSLPRQQFRELAAGYGGTAAVEYLAGTQRSVNRALLAAVQERAVRLVREAARAADVPAAWQVLTSADRSCPQAVTAVLDHPGFRVWATRALGWLDGRDAAGETLAAGLSYLTAVAAATAIRGGLTARLTIPLRDHAVFLPTLGTLAVAPGELADGPLGLEITADAVTARTDRSELRLPRRELLTGPPPAGDAGPLAWRPARTLHAAGLAVTLDDADPYRGHDPARPVAPALPEAEFAAWQRAFTAAWDEIVQQHPAYAPALAAGLRTIVPLAPAPGGRGVSYTARDAFGSLAIALPPDPDTLALLIIHEFQHVKLGAMLDLYDLFDPTDQRLFAAPWRPDKRPLEGLLQGTYAHVAVTGYWRARWRAATADAGRQLTAGLQFKYWRAGTAAAIGELRRSGSLTPMGRDLVGALEATVKPWLSEAAPSGQWAGDPVLKAAGQAELAHAGGSGDQP
jgi:uncharacterized protein